MTTARTGEAPRVALYARYSTDLQNPRSIGDQFADCERFAQQRGWQISARHHDEERTSMTMHNRPGLEGLLATAKAKAFDIILVEAMDRLSRAPGDLYRIFEILRFNGVELWDKSSGRPADLTSVGVQSIVGAHFMAHLSDKVRRGMAGKARNGQLSGRVTYGYRLAQPGVWEIDPVKAEIVRRIFEEYAAGKGPRHIAEDLNREGVPGPSGGRWDHGNLAGGPSPILQNKLFIGKRVWNTTRTHLNPETGRKVHRRTPESEHEVFDFPHLRIVSDELFERAQRVRELRGKSKNLPPKGSRIGMPMARNRGLLAGLLRCGKCGAGMMIVQRGKTKSGRVACSVATRDRLQCEHTKSYDAAELERLTLELVKTQLVDPRLLGEFIEAYQAERRTLARKREASGVKARDRLRQVNKRIDALMDAVGDGLIERDAFRERIGALNEELKRVKAEVNALDEEPTVDLHPHAVARFRHALDELHDRFAHGEEPGTAARAALRELIDSVVVTETPKGAPYRIEVIGKLAALLGIPSDATIFPRAVPIYDQNASLNGTP